MEVFMAKNIIFYFTGTGNSLFVANQIAEKIGDCTLVSMGEDYQLQYKYDTIGFVAPLYACGLPGRVSQFVKSLNLSQNKDTYLFSVITSGSGKPMTANGQLNKILQKQGVKLSYCNNVRMMGNYVCMYDMSPDVQSKVQAGKEKAEQVVTEIVKKSTTPAPKYIAPMNLANHIFVSSSRKKAEKFNVSNDCIACGLCASICPVKNIKMVDGRPTFASHCEQCVACIQWCPKKAINYKNITQTRGRYHNPDVTVNQLKRS